MKLTETLHIYDGIQDGNVICVPNTGQNFADLLRDYLHDNGIDNYAEFDAAVLLLRDFALSCTTGRVSFWIE